MRGVRKKPMTFVTWSSEFETGIPFIDADHKLLVNLINQAHTCIKQQEETSVLSSVFTALFDYTEYHFSREEKMMELADYEGVTGHKKAHRYLAQQVADLERIFRTELGQVNARDVRNFLNSWLLEHIKDHDFRYLEACKDNVFARENARSARFMDEARIQEGDRNLSELSVMVVDDSLNFQTLIETVLKALGIRRLQLESNGADALDSLIKRPVDIVFCDWVMEDMNGAELARKVMDLELPTKVVLLTGYSIDTLQTRATHVNVEAFLEKPVSPRDILRTLSSVDLN